MIDKNLSIAVVGCGWWGKNIIKTLKQDLGLNRIIGIDPSFEALEEVKESFQIDTSDNIENLFSRNSFDAVCIASPPETHYELTKLFLESGKHVLIEKPPATNLDQLNELNEIAARNRLVYMLDCLYIFSDSIQKLKKIINDEFKRKIRFIHFKRIGDELRRESAGISRINNTMFNNNVDVLDDLFFHDAGILFHLFDSNYEVKSLTKLNLFHKQLIDTAFIDISGEHEVKIDLSWTLIPRERKITIFCDDRILEFDAYNSSNTISIHILKTMESKKIDYKNDMPLTNMLKYFISVINSYASTNYIGNYELMSKIMRLKLSL